jgi:thiosulfate/3-mercaptopyruvate sulfurtransferase
VGPQPGRHEFWFLEYFRHPHVRLLDGGFGAWTRAGLPVSTSPLAPSPTEWHGEPDPTPLATWKDVYDRLGDAGTTLLDTRSDAEYYGALVRAKRGGAIPGAVHLEWKENLTADGSYKSAADLRDMYTGIGVAPDRQVIAYCQGGYRAAHTYVALRVLGFPHVKSYLGSWKEWGDREDLPLERPAARS